jgi:hypothetical protein
MRRYGAGLGTRALVSFGTSVEPSCDATWPPGTSDIGLRTPDFPKGKPAGFLCPSRFGGGRECIVAQSAYVRSVRID